MNGWKHRTAVVTGAASGIGKALVLDFARRGMSVVLADIEAAPLRDAGEEAAALGVEVLTCETDVSDADSVRALADAAYGRFGAIHVLCNNAGVSAGGVALTEAELADWRWVLGVNLWGVVHGIDAFLRRMLAAGEPGHIVNTGSILGMVAAWPRTAPYVASKYAVVGLSEALALELEGTALGVTVVCPGVVNTSIFESERNRPSALRVERESVNLRARMETVSADWVTPEEVSARVMRAIEEERLYVFTHPDAPELIDGRFDRIRQDYP